MRRRSWSRRPAPASALVDSRTERDPGCPHGALRLTSCYPSLGTSPARNVCYRVGGNLSLVTDFVKRAGGTGSGHSLTRPLFGAYIWTIGRTSMAPTSATGHLAAYATASSRSLASIT